MQAVAAIRTAFLGGFGDPHKVGLADVSLWHEVFVHGDEVCIRHGCGVCSWLFGKYTAAAKE